MARINSKQKGNTFERKIANMLSKWSGEDFHRTPMSGALHWKDDTRVVSDIVSPQVLMDKGWNVSIECKKVEYDWEFSKIIEGTSTFWKHWEQAEGDAKASNQVPLLVFNKNRRNTYCAMWLSTFCSLNIIIPNRLVVWSDTKAIVIFNFEELLASISCEDMIKRLDK